MTIKPRFKDEKDYTQYKIFENQNLIWDWQFKRFKNRVERERYRNEYDVIKARLENIDLQIKTNPPEADKLQEEKIRLESDLASYKENMRVMDVELSGVKEDFQKNDKGELVRDEKGMPVRIEAQPGIETMIEALRELIEVYKAYLKIL